MTVTFGRRLPEFTLELQYDGDFDFELEASIALPVGASAEFRFHHQADPTDDPIPVFIWPAVVSGIQVVWGVPREDVADVLDSGARHVRLRYGEASGATRAWMRGIVNAS